MKWGNSSLVAISPQLEQLHWCTFHDYTKSGILSGADMSLVKLFLKMKLPYCRILWNSDALKTIYAKYIWTVKPWLLSTISDWSISKTNPFYNYQDYDSVTWPLTCIFNHLKIVCNSRYKRPESKLFILKCVAWAQILSNSNNITPNFLNQSMNFIPLKSLTVLK